MTSTKDRADVLIVGAGLSGLAAAQILGNQGLVVQVLDKGRSVGGRLATRRLGRGVADHGAQFFTVRSPLFRDYVDRWLADDKVFQWSNGFSDGTKSNLQVDGHARYATRGGMNALAKHLASQMPKSVTIHPDVKVTSLKPVEGGWQVDDEAGTVYLSRSVVLTPPAPQALALFGDAVVQLSSSDRLSLERIAYAPCVAGLFQIEGQVNLPEPGALQQSTAPISWIGDNHRKGISPNATIITVHANGDYSRELWDMREELALAKLREALELHLEAGAVISEAQLKRWRYAQPTVLHSDRYLLAGGVPPLIFAGDGFGEARVEGAFLSGLAAAGAFTERLK